METNLIKDFGVYPPDPDAWVTTRNNLPANCPVWVEYGDLAEVCFPISGRVRLKSDGEFDWMLRWQPVRFVTAEAKPTSEANKEPVAPYADLKAVKPEPPTKEDWISIQHLQYVGAKLPEGLYYMCEDLEDKPVILYISQNNVTDGLDISYFGFAQPCRFKL